jgi:hypothetical protein
VTNNELSDEEYLILLEEAEADRQWIIQNYPVLAKKYPNEYVCVRRGVVVRNGQDIDALSDSLGIDVVCEYIQPHGTAMLL